jgi:hypothetical protein
MKWVEWIEPFGVNNEPVYMRVLPEVAIAVQKKCVEQSNLKNNRQFSYSSDEQALDDFMVVNWAMFKECSCGDPVEVK